MCLNPIPINVSKLEHFPKWIRVPCGKCTECQEKYSNEWAFRCVKEAEQYENNCFVTLTYSDEPFIIDSDDTFDGKRPISLDRTHVINFIKRLRKAIYPNKVRYFYCGEYGSKGGRPHYHILFFGWKPSDTVFLKFDERGNPIYKSNFLSDCWLGFDSYHKTVANRFSGFCSVGDITIQSAKYCAKYMQKFQKLPEGFVKPFTGCSTHPGLAYLSRFESDLECDSLYHNGQRIQIPRFFLNKLEEDGFDITNIKDRRMLLSEISDSFTLREKRLKKSLDFLGKD